jgi:hypothetical protein
MKQKLWITLITCLAYCVDKELWKAIDYLKEQVRVMQEQQEEDKRILLNNYQRIRLAAKAEQLTRRLLEETTVLSTPETVLCWYRKLIAQKYDGSKNCKNPGRPKTSQEIIDLVIRFKQENPHWGYTRIKDYIVYRGYKIGETTVKNILLANGCENSQLPLNFWTRPRLCAIMVRLTTRVNGHDALRSGPSQIETVDDWEDNLVV